MYQTAQREGEFSISVRLRSDIQVMLPRIVYRILQEILLNDLPDKLDQGAGFHRANRLHDVATRVSLGRATASRVARASQRCFVSCGLGFKNHS